MDAYTAASTAASAAATVDAVRDPSEVAGSSYTWRAVSVKAGFNSKTIKPRAGHVQFSLPNSKNRFWVHGGLAKGGEYLEDLHFFDTKLKRWFPAKVKAKPSSRAYHAMCLCAPSTATIEAKGRRAMPRVFMYGGIATRQLRDEINLIEDWSAFSSFASSKNDRWTSTKGDFEHSGSVPLGRCNHSLTMLPGGAHVLMFGGWHGTFVNDLYVVDTERMRWNLKVPKANPRSKIDFTIMPRAGHAAFALPAQRIDRGPMGSFVGPVIVFFGGQTDGNMQIDEMLVLDVTHWEWHRPRPMGRSPVARSGHSACVVEEVSKVFIFGGWDGGKVRDDLHVLVTKGDMYTDWHWEDQSVRGASVDPRVGHGAALLGNCIWFYGGMGKDETFLDTIVCLELPSLKKPKRTKTKAEGATASAGGTVSRTSSLRSHEGDDDGDGDGDGDDPHRATPSPTRLRRPTLFKVSEYKDSTPTKGPEEEIEEHIGKAVEAVARKIQVLQATRKEAHMREQEVIEEQLGMAQRRSVFTLVQRHGKTLDDAIDIANGYGLPQFADEGADVDATSRRIVSQAIMPLPPRVKSRKAAPASGLSPWEEAKGGGVEKNALEQIALNGGLMKTWGALLGDSSDEDDDERERAAAAAAAADAEAERMRNVARYELSLEQGLKGDNLEALIEAQTERRFMFSQEEDRDAKKEAQEKKPKAAGRPRRFADAAKIVMTSASFASELAKIVEQGKGVRDEDAADAPSLASLASGADAGGEALGGGVLAALPTTTKALPWGTYQAAYKVLSMFRTNMYRKRYLRLRAIVRIQAFAKGWLQRKRMEKERGLRCVAYRESKARPKHRPETAREIKEVNMMRDMREKNIAFKLVSIRTKKKKKKKKKKAKQ